MSGIGAEVGDIIAATQVEIFICIEPRRPTDVS